MELVYNKENMLPHQQRVVEEKDELAEKIYEIVVFTGSAVFNNLQPVEQDRLNRQLKYMNLYYDVLQERINAF